MSSTVESANSLQHRQELLKGVPGPNTATSTNLRRSLSTEETLYAIPLPLLHAIETTQHDWPVRNRWLSADQLLQEKRFSQQCTDAYSIGYSARGYVAFPELDMRKPVQPFASERVQSLLDLLSQKSGVNFTRPLSSYTAIHDLGNDSLSQFREQRLAYLGWLLTHKEFQEDRYSLMQSWQADGSRSLYLEGRKSVLDVSNTPSANSSHKEVAQAFLAFYRRWDLERLASWELPVQQQANLGAPANLGAMMDLDGPVIQLPSTMKLPSKLKVATFLNVQDSDALQEFREVLNNKQTKRLAEGFVVHFYQEIVIRPILGNLLVRSQSCLDQLLADTFSQVAPLPELIGISVETVKKVRQSFQRR